ncbi:hypothetical protein BIWAKO_07013 [Bosea sp. BIWAKO-01]|nr:hypothetical protein [Bosea sp. BIWAKO-01]GAU87060.1 hypothetical protein BIWAKO_07013 [Bosea sp. BIWAKO-01]
MAERDRIEGDGTRRASGFITVSNVHRSRGEARASADFDRETQGVTSRTGTVQIDRIRAEVGHSFLSGAIEPAAAFAAMRAGKAPPRGERKSASSAFPNRGSKIGARALQHLAE